jgi:hypothetical protein
MRRETSAQILQGVKLKLLIARAHDRHKKTAMKKRIGILLITLLGLCTQASAQWVGVPATSQANTSTGAFRWLFGSYGVFDPAGYLKKADSTLFATPSYVNTHLTGPGNGMTKASGVFNLGGNLTVGIDYYLQGHPIRYLMDVTGATGFVIDPGYAFFNVPPSITLNYTGGSFQASGTDLFQNFANSGGSQIGSFHATSNYFELTRVGAGSFHVTLNSDGSTEIDGGTKIFFTQKTGGQQASAGNEFVTLDQANSIFQPVSTNPFTTYPLNASALPTPATGKVNFGFDINGSEYITKANGDTRVIKFPKAGNDTVFMPNKNKSHLVDSTDAANTFQPTGITAYDKVFWSDLSDFTATGFTPPISSLNGITFTGGTNDLTKFITLNGYTNNSRAQDFEVNYIVNDLSGYGPQIGRLSINTTAGACGVRFGE